MDSSDLLASCFALLTRESVAEIKSKERAIEALAKKYASSEISEDDIKMCLYSIGDNNSYLTFNRDPVDKMIRHLTTYFRPDEQEVCYFREC